MVELTTSGEPRICVSDSVKMETNVHSSMPTSETFPCADTMSSLWSKAKKDFDKDRDPSIFKKPLESLTTDASASSALPFNLKERTSNENGVLTFERTIIDFEITIGPAPSGQRCKYYAANEDEDAKHFTDGRRIQAY